MLHNTSNTQLNTSRGIADTYVLSMGPKMKQFEGPIDPLTGTVLIDHVFEPLVVSPEANDHMVGHHEFDPEDELMKVQVKSCFARFLIHSCIFSDLIAQDCVCGHIYCNVPDKEGTGRWTPMLVSQECLDLKKLMARSIQLTEGLIEAHDGGDEGKRAAFERDVQDPDALVPTQNNFSKTFALKQVLPFHCEAHHPAHDRGHTFTAQACGGLLQVGHSHGKEFLQSELEGMKAEYAKLVDGVDAYEKDKASGGNLDLSKHSFMTSDLRNMVHVSEIVRLQESLQQAYCMHGVQSSDLQLSEQNSLQYSSGSTCRQLHGSKAIFTVCMFSDIV